VRPSITAPGAGGPEALALRLAAAHDRSVLDPVERFSEIAFGLVMVLTFTGALSVVESGREEVREMLVAALGCNVAWGVVDGVMYVVTTLVARARLRNVIGGIRAASPEGARAIVLAALPEGIALVTDASEADRIAARVRALPEPPHAPLVGWADLRAALVACFLVVIATFPPTLPFLLMHEVHLALRVSNAAAVVSLFLAGYSLGRATGVRPWALGAAMVLVGGALVALTIALGG